MDSTYYSIVLLLELKLILVCAIVLARLCHVDVTVVPIRWHSCANKMWQSCHLAIKVVSICYT